MLPRLLLIAVTVTAGSLLAQSPAPVASAEPVRPTYPVPGMSSSSPAGGGSAGTSARSKRPERLYPQRKRPGRGRSFRRRRSAHQRAFEWRRQSECSAAWLDSSRRTYTHSGGLEAYRSLRSRLPR